LIFQKFIPSLQVVLQGKLPGIQGQSKLAPHHRLPLSTTLPKNINPKIGSVLILLYPKKNSVYTVLILRNEYKGVHSKQISFPGGKFETSDLNLSQTALRESAEEIGICKENVQILGKLSPLYIPPSNFLVTPFIGATYSIPDFKADPREVFKIIETPLSNLLDEEKIAHFNILIDTETSILAPGISLEDGIIWGATAMIIGELQELLKPLLIK
jgi:8-oxo-dGTP pyrophosphatase MutT (NUDIX family)